MRNLLFAAGLLYLCCYTSVSAIAQSCLNIPVQNRTQWEQYLFEVCTGPKLQEQCYPYMIPPPDPHTPANGLLVYFHGYSACPGSSIGFSNYIASNLNFYVYNFLFPGHGRAYNDCTVATECADGYPTESLPSTRQPYVDLVKRAVSIIQEEVPRLNLQGKTIAVSGLSHGGVAATYAVAISGGLFTHQVAMNAFFGISNFQVDDLQYQCQALGTSDDICVLDALNATLKNLGVNASAAAVASNTANLAVQAFLNTVSGIEMSFMEKWALAMNIFRNALGEFTENAYLLPANLTSFMDDTVGWGDFCVQTMQQVNRGGFCSFKVKNMLAAHSFAQYALAQSRLISNSIDAQFMSIERDGLTRNALQWQAAQAEARNGANVHMCMFQVADGCTEFNDNICGVPHSAIDPADEIMLAPYTVYWQPFLFSRVAGFLNKTHTPMGVPKFNGSNIGECVSQSLSSPDPKLVGYVISGGILQLENNWIASTGILDAVIGNTFMQQLQQPDWAVVFIRLENTGLWSLLGGNRFLVEVPDYIEPVLIQSITNGSMSTIFNFKVVSYTQESTQKVFKPPTAIELE